MALKYGIRYGNELALFSTKIEMKASEVLSPKSGRYVVYDYGDNYWYACDDNAAVIGGYVQQSLTCSATDGGTKLSCALNVDMFYCELPYAASGAAATLTAAVLLDIMGAGSVDGSNIDLYVTGSVQYADNATSQNVLSVGGGSVARNTLYTRVVSAKMGKRA